MKKIISLVLLLSLCLGLFAGCDLTQFIPGNKPVEPASNLENAKSLVFNTYKPANKDEIPEKLMDFEVMTSVLVEGETFPVAWTVEITAGAADAVKIVDGSSDAFKKVDITEQPAEEVKFTLTATISDAEGNTATVSFNYMTPKYIAPSIGVIASPVAGTAYKFAMLQGKANKIYYLKGGMDGYYMATSDKEADAIDVYLEETTGGYYLYCMVEGAKTYINMVTSVDANDSTKIHVNGKYEATASTVYTYDATLKTVKTSINDAEYIFGTRNDKSYTTIGPVKADSEPFTCQFYGEGGETPDLGGDETPDTPNTPDQPANPNDAIANALAAADGTEVTLTGTISSIKEVWSEKHSNISVYLTNEYGSTILLYQMATKVAVGDVVTVTGKVGSYNGAKQIAKGATAQITGHSDDYNPVEMTITEALAAADGKNIIVTGTVVEIETAYDAANNRLSVYISDDAGNKLYLYRLSGNVELGQIIKVTGAMASHEEAKQVVAGTFEATGTHACAEFTTATCTEAAKCTFCNKVNGVALGHKDENKDHVCDNGCEEKQGTHIDLNGDTVCDYGCAEKIEAGEGATLVAKEYTYTFAEKIYSANATQELNGKKWTLAGEGGYWGYDNQNGKGQQFGSGGNPYKAMTFTSEAFNNVSKIVINTSGASGIEGTLTVSVGGTAVKTITLTKTATDYEINVDGLSGAIEFNYTQTSSKAIYIKSIAVNYAEYE